MHEPRQAVILIHGIGEQRPMDTLRGFVDAVLGEQSSTSQPDAKYYNKPDLLSDNLELRRLVSAGGRIDRTDFFEFYWAHLMPAATWDRLASWYSVLMLRGPKDLPMQITLLYILSWLIFLLILASGISEVVRFVIGYPIDTGVKLPWLVAAVGGIFAMTILSYVGDAAVYLSPSPSNIEARQKIRASGLKLLDNVVNSGRYDRVVVVGHSLGSIIGYDILTFAWQRHSQKVRDTISAAWARGSFPARSHKAISAAEKVARDISGDRTASNLEDIHNPATEWRHASRNVYKEQIANDDGWIITDFVTLGSPLAHGSLLLAKDRNDFEQRARERELPHCPPVGEDKGRFSFEHKDIDHKKRPQNAIVLNHAAVFSVVSWTNLYFPCRCLLYGDLIGGPIAPLFGPGVRDVPVATRTWGGLLAHTQYWRSNPADKDPATAPITRLREALDLNRQRL